MKGNTNITNEKKTRDKGLCVTLTIVVVALALLYIISGHISMATGGELSPRDTVEMQPDGLEDISSGWTVTYEDGTTEAIDLPHSVKTEPGESVTISREWQDTDFKNPTLLFEYKRYGVEVFADDDLLWKVNCSSIAKRMVFTGWTKVTLPSDSRTPSHINIRFSGSSDGVYNVYSIGYNSLDAVRFEILRTNFITLILLILIGMVGIEIFITYIVYKSRSYSVEKVFLLGGYTILGWIWGITDSSILAATNIPHEMVGLTLYLALALLPLPMLVYVWKSCNSKSRVMPKVLYVGIANVVLQIVLSWLGLIKISDTFLISQLYAFVVVVVAIRALVFAYRREKTVSNRLSLYGGITLGVLSMVACAVYWIIGAESSYRNFMLFGTFAFMVCLTIGITTEYVRKSRADQKLIQEAEIHEKLSYIDPLTDLRNRRSFEIKLEEIDANKESYNDAVLVMCDLNGLKLTNDTFGHSAGDDLIIEAAKALTQVFEEEGDCYRIGGDEYAVIIKSPSHSITYLDEMLDEEIDSRNISNKWKLSIARGYSRIRTSTGARRTISDWKMEADIQMYRNKIELADGSNNRSYSQDLRSIMEAIVVVVDARDTYTASHSERVRELSQFIGEKLGLSDATISRIGVAANLHDIGKIGIPDMILRKEGPLTDEEFKVIKTHTTIGAQLISKASSMKEIVDIVKYHHERFDGKGYPCGLRGGNIPIESRIIAIADSIDAMTSKRVYRDGMTLDQCKDEIEKNAGIMYDPAITKIVLENWSGIQDIVLLHPKKLIRGNVQ